MGMTLRRWTDLLELPADPMRDQILRRWREETRAKVWKNSRFDKWLAAQPAKLTLKYYLPALSADEDSADISGQYQFVVDAVSQSQINGLQAARP